MKGMGNTKQEYKGEREAAAGCLIINKKATTLLWLLKHALMAEQIASLSLTYSRSTSFTASPM
ncbi:hypothetical protein GCM10007414_02380 [Agarivorans gilvus]|uniref:Uncharacterized protein n=1 Tax=Agarivorans gilvus TaxID=680279 RepID=A0ABQ1HWH1_9ALTE|nr:hypothetical protein GCM10007414_02380 [Agarivorans gilvus]